MYDKLDGIYDGFTGLIHGLDEIYDNFTAFYVVLITLFDDLVQIRFI